MAALLADGPDSDSYSPEKFQEMAVISYMSANSLGAHATGATFFVVGVLGFEVVVSQGVRDPVPGDSR